MNNLSDIMKEIMKSEIIDELLLEYPNESKFINNKCNIYLKNIKLDTDIKPRYNKGYISRSLFNYKRNCCEAQIWNDGHMGQCSHLKKENKLCMKHYKILKKYGKLHFGYINTDKS